MAASATTARERVRALNDRLRQHGIGGTTVVTPGVRALAPTRSPPFSSLWRASAPLMPITASTITRS
jgi:hypothetical protein